MIDHDRRVDHGRRRRVSQRRRNQQLRRAMSKRRRSDIPLLVIIRAHIAGSDGCSSGIGLMCFDGLLDRIELFDPPKCLQ